VADFLLRLQDSNFGVWVSTSPSILAYPTILMLHTVGLAMVVGPNAVLNLRVLGAGSGVPFAALRPVFTVMAIGFAINASTGLALFISEAGEKGMAPIFWIKLSIIAAALVAAWRMKRALYGPGSAVSADAAGAGPKRLAWLSLALWLGAIFAGRLMAYLS
jgi:hypothetical protein